MKNTLLLILTLTLATNCYAQSDTLTLDNDTVRVEKIAEPKDDDSEDEEVSTFSRGLGSIKTSIIEKSKLTYTASLSGNYASGTVNRFLISTSHNMNFKFSRFTLPLYGSYSYGKQNDLLREREFSYVATPTIKLEKWRFYLNSEFEKSNVRGVRTRYLNGGGVGYTFYSKNDNDISISNLTLYEKTNYTNGQVRELFRNSARLRARLRYKTVSLTSITFHQPSYTDLRNFRLSNNTTFSMKVVSKIAFTLNYQYTYESLAVVKGKEKANTFITAGFSFSHK